MKSQLAGCIGVFCEEATGNSCGAPKWPPIKGLNCPAKQLEAQRGHVFVLATTLGFLAFHGGHCFWIATIVLRPRRLRGERARQTKTGSGLNGKCESSAEHLAWWAQPHTQGKIENLLQPLSSSSTSSSSSSSLSSTWLG